MRSGSRGCLHQKRTRMVYVKNEASAIYNYTTQCSVTIDVRLDREKDIEKAIEFC